MKLIKKIIMQYGAELVAVIYQARFMLLSLILSLSAGAVYSAPTGGNVVAGNASITSSGNRTDINQNSQRAVIDWQGFGITSNEHVNFNQPGKNAVALNRVTGSQLSRIDGKLTANGNVFLINRNGVVFGRGAQVDVNSLLATTSDIKNEDFMAGRMNFKAPSGAVGSIVNEGTITVAEGGLVALVAPTVRNAGVINARLGKVELAAGERFTLDMYGDDLIKVAVSDSLAKQLVENSGQINVDGGIVTLSASQAKGAIDDVVNMSGSIQARSVAKRAGKIILSGGDGGVIVTGNLDVNGASAQGGTVDVLGNRIRLKQTARIDASGAAGGGEIHIGGDFQGKGTRQKASNTTIDAGAEVLADATIQGEGGRIIVWSDKQTNVDGNLSARGGVNGGDGGFIETSSAGRLNFNQRAKVEARGKGKPGTWLLDPEDITIGSAQAGAISDSLNSGGNVSIKTADQGSGEGNITVNAPIRKTEGGDASLSMQAHNNIAVNAPITSSESKLNVSLTAGNAISVNAPVDTNGGNFGTSITGVIATETTLDTQQGEVAESGETTVQDEAVQVAQDESSEVLPEEALAEQSEQSEAQVDQVENVVANVADPAPADGISPSEPIASVPAAGSSPADIAAMPETTAPVPVDPVVDESQTIAASTTPMDDTGITINEAVNSGGGSIAINACDQGTATINSTLDTSNTNTGETGGSVEILGESVVLTENAQIDASGDSGGGDVKVGGAYQGLGSTPTAKTTMIADGATIKSNAINSGNGGDVIVWADDSTNFQGHIEAKGGQASGNGGLVEVSGKQTLRFNGTVDTSAANGVTGSLLLDPTELTITNTGTATDTANELDFATINTLGANNNVTVQVTDDIVFARFDNNTAVPMDVVVSLVQELGKTVAFRSTDGSIVFVNPNDTLETSGANLDFDAGDTLTLGSLKTKGGTVTLTAGNDISLQKIDTRINPQGVISTDADMDFELNEVGNDIAITSTSGDVVLNDRISTGSRDVVINAQSGNIIGHNEGIIDTLILQEGTFMGMPAIQSGFGGYVELSAEKIQFDLNEITNLRNTKPAEYIGGTGNGNIPYRYGHVNYGALKIIATDSVGESIAAGNYSGSDPLSIQGEFTTPGSLNIGDIEETDIQLRIELAGITVEITEVSSGSGFSITGDGTIFNVFNPNGTQDLNPQVVVDAGTPGTETIACPPCVPDTPPVPPSPPTPPPVVDVPPSPGPGPTPTPTPNPVPAPTPTVVLAPAPNGGTDNVPPIQPEILTIEPIASAAEIDREQDRTVIASQDEGDVQISTLDEDKCAAFGVSAWLAGGARDASSSADLGRSTGNSNNANLKAKSECLAGNTQAAL